MSNELRDKLLRIAAEEWDEQPSGEALLCGQDAVTDFLHQPEVEALLAARQKPLHEDLDARRWAAEFNQTLVDRGSQPFDPGFLIAWFANAIMCGYDTYCLQQEEAVRKCAPGAWLPLLEMFPDNKVLLHGAAGEDAMNVGDVIALVKLAANSATLARFKQLGRESYAAIQGWYPEDFTETEGPFTYDKAALAIQEECRLGREAHQERGELRQALARIADSSPPETNQEAWSLVNAAKRSLGRPQQIVNPPQGWTP